MRRLASLVFVCASANAQLPPLPETASHIEYPSVPEALAALRAKPGVEISTQNGWTIVTEPARHVLWSFAPSGHPAYPAVVKRDIVEQDGKIAVRMGVKCGATKEACDALVREFIGLNEKMRAEFQSRGSGAQ